MSDTWILFACQIFVQNRKIFIFFLTLACLTAMYFGMNNVKIRNLFLK